MKRSIIAASVLSAIFMSAGVFAADSGELTIQGEVTGTSCQFVDGHTSATIELASIPDTFFDNVNIGQDVTYGEGRAAAPLEIKCGDGSTNVRVFISGDEVDNNGVIIPGVNDGYVTGVGFKLFHNNNSIAKSGSVGIPLSEFPTSADGAYKLDLAARYAKRTNSITSGVVNAKVILKVVQE
ncbi:fimbrial protein [Citrobacter sp. FR21RM1OL9030]|uniref:fimbrial protein n=1 Tax=Citrobacter sp. FR21RM1OL9030 TaxID=3381297 RepID=UPI003A97E352|nr:fimbrial protein [Citrobacter koseri]